MSMNMNTMMGTRPAMTMNMMSVIRQAMTMMHCKVPLVILVYSYS